MARPRKNHDSQVEGDPDLENPENEPAVELDENGKPLHPEVDAQPEEENQDPDGHLTRWGYQGKPMPAGVPEPTAKGGDLAPNVVKYYKDSLDADQFSAMYPNRRLRAAGLERFIGKK